MFHSNYWNCSKLADKLRGVEKPEYASCEEWEDWKINVQSKHPYRYWLVEEFLIKIQDTIFYIPNKLNEFRYYLNNRFVSKPHALIAHPRDIKPGQWQDVGYRFLPCLFNALVDFVEIEKAWLAVRSDSKKYSLPWYFNQWYTRWFTTYRNPIAGLDYLDWESSLIFNEENMGFSPDHELYGKPTPQAENAREIKKLYLWWTVERPARPDYMEVSGWNKLCKEYGLRLLGNKRSKEEEEKFNTAHKIMNELEEQYEKEDEEMLIRLIKIRKSLWT